MAGTAIEGDVTTAGGVPGRRPADGPYRHQDAPKTYYREDTEAMVEAMKKATGK